MCADPKAFHIDDLANPIPTEAHRRALEQATRQRVELTADSVLTAAQTATGYDCFGSDDFRKRLGLWLDIVSSDPDRTPLGRLLFFKRCVRYASTRLSLNELLVRHPEILEVEIRRPIIIVGPPRTGTTHLVNLLATERTLRSLRRWEIVDPIPFTRNKIDAKKSSDSRLDKCYVECNQITSMLPHMSAMHPIAPGDVVEEIDLQGPDFSYARFESLLLGSGFRPDSRTVPDQTPHYEYMKVMLKALQWLTGPNQWVLKSPIHSKYIRPLMTTFPDAIIVITHRDPISIIGSRATMAAYALRLDYNRVDLNKVVSQSIERTESMLRLLLRDRSLIPRDRLIDVTFHSLTNDMMAIIGEIYSKAQLELTDQQRTRIEGTLSGPSGDSTRRLSYNIRRDFGVDPDLLRRRFVFYYDRFPSGAAQ